jgi:hypothetical protein
MNTRETFEELFRSLIKKHGLTYDGEDIEPDIHDVDEVVELSFEDEGIAHLIAGNVSCNIYDEMERAISDLGYEIIDTDGTIMKLFKTK